VGFLALPIPAGLGVREAVLAGVLHGEFPAAVLVAASVYHRLVVIASEGIMAAIASHRVRPARLRAAAAADDLTGEMDADERADSDAAPPLPL
jgi:hypothetical protein